MVRYFLSRRSKPKYFAPNRVSRPVLDFSLIDGPGFAGSIHDDPSVQPWPFLPASGYWAVSENGAAAYGLDIVLKAGRIEVLANHAYDPSRVSDRPAGLLVKEAEGLFNVYLHECR